MLNTAQIASFLQRKIPFSFEKKDEFYFSIVVPSFDPETGCPCEPTKIHLSLIDVLEKKAQLEKEIEACDAVLRGANEVLGK